MRRFWSTLDAREWDAFGALLTDDVEARWPQSRERVRGRDALVRFMAAFPGAWHVRVERAAVEGDTGASLTAFTVDGRTVPGATFFDLAPDGRVAGFTEFWPEPYDPPPGRAHLVEPLPG